MKEVRLILLMTLVLVVGILFSQEIMYVTHNGFGEDNSYYKTTSINVCFQYEGIDNLEFWVEPLEENNWNYFSYNNYRSSQHLTINNSDLSSLLTTVEGHYIIEKDASHNPITIQANTSQTMDNLEFHLREKGDIVDFLNEDFEETFPPNGWLKLNPDAGTGWEPLEVGTSPLPGWSNGEATACPDGGQWQAYCTWTTGGAGSNDQWIITPQVSVQTNEMLDFWMKYYFSSYDDYVEIRISTTDQYDVSAFNIIVDQIDFNSESTTDWTQYTYNLTDFVTAGTAIYIGFREYMADNVNDGSAISIDNVLVGTSTAYDSIISDPQPTNVDRDLHYSHIPNTRVVHASDDSIILKQTLPVSDNLRENEDIYISRVVLDKPFTEINIQTQENLAIQFLPILLMDDGKGIKNDGLSDIYTPNTVDVLFSSDDQLYTKIMKRNSEGDEVQILNNASKEDILKYNSSEYFIKFHKDDDEWNPISPGSEINTWYESNGDNYDKKIYASFFKEYDEQSQTNKIILMYWFYSLYNNNDGFNSIWPEQTQITNHHLSDWEGMCLVFNEGSYDSPIFAATSSHISIGIKRKWNKVFKVGDHPIIFVCNGSHAAYFAPGRSRSESPDLVQFFLGDQRTDYHFGKGNWILPNDVFWYQVRDALSEYFGSGYTHNDNIFYTEGDQVEVLPRLYDINLTQPERYWHAFGGFWGQSLLSGSRFLETKSPSGPPFVESKNSAGTWTNGYKWFKPLEWAEDMRDDTIFEFLSITPSSERDESFDVVLKLKDFDDNYVTDALEQDFEVLVANQAEIVYPTENGPNLSAEIYEDGYPLGISEFEYHFDDDSYTFSISDNIFGELPFGTYDVELIFRDPSPTNPSKYGRAYERSGITISELLSPEFVPANLSVILESEVGDNLITITENNGLGDTEIWYTFIIYDVDNPEEEPVEPVQGQCFSYEYPLNIETLLGNNFPRHIRLKAKVFYVDPSTGETHESDSVMSTYYLQANEPIFLAVDVLCQDPQNYYFFEPMLEIELSSNTNSDDPIINYQINSGETIEYFDPFTINENDLVPGGLNDNEQLAEIEAWVEIDVICTSDHKTINYIHGVPVCTFDPDDSSNFFEYGIISISQIREDDDIIFITYSTEGTMEDLEDPAFELDGTIPVAAPNTNTIEFNNDNFPNRQIFLEEGFINIKAIAVGLLDGVLEQSAVVSQFYKIQGTDIDSDYETGTTTLTKENSPFYVKFTPTNEGKITIWPDATLIIEPGVEIFFEDGTYFVVEGSIQANGTDAEPIIMRGMSDVLRTWNGIKFIENAALNPPFNPESIFEYCEFYNCNDYSINCEDVNESVYLSIDNTKIINSENGICFSSSTLPNLPDSYPVFTVANTTISECNLAVHTLNSIIRFENCNIFDNQQGFELLNVGGDIINCEIRDNHRNTSYTNGNGGGIHIENTVAFEVELNIINCLIINNSVFEQLWGGGVFILRHILSNAPEVNLINNTIMFNEAYSGGGLSLCEYARPNIINTVISKNSVNIPVNFNSDDILYAFDGTPNNSDINPIYYNCGFKYEDGHVLNRNIGVYGYIPSIGASDWYFNSEIEETWLGFFHEESCVWINAETWLFDPGNDDSGIDSGNNQAIDDWELDWDILGNDRIYNYNSNNVDIGAYEYPGNLQHTGELSGFISNNIELLGDIHVTADVTIPTNVTVTIAPGTVFSCDEDCLIRVKGSINANGEEDNNILFTSSNPDNLWQGFVAYNWYNMLGDLSFEHCTFENVIYCEKYAFTHTAGPITVIVGTSATNDEVIVQIKNCIFQNNIGEFGGAIGLYDFNVGNTGKIIATIEDCIFINNTACYGGAIYSWNTSPMIMNNIISENSVLAAGGGIEIYGNFEEANVNIINNLICNNISENGGGIYFNSVQDGALVANNTIVGNSAFHGFQYDRGLRTDLIIPSTPSKPGENYSSKKIEENNDTRYLGTLCGLGGGFGISKPEGNYDLINNIFWGNSTDYHPDYLPWLSYHGSGKEILVEIENSSSEYSVNLINCDIEGGVENINNHNIPPSEIPIVVYDLSQNELPVNLIGTLNDNINADPAFTSDIDHPYSISENSICINGGDNNVTNLPETDLKDEVRIYQGLESVIDIGAYEYQGDPPPIMVVTNDIEHFEIFVEDSITQSFTIRNDGLSDLLISDFVFPDFIDISLSGPSDNTGSKGKENKIISNDDKYPYKASAQKGGNLRNEITIPPIPYNEEITLDLTFYPDCYGDYTGDLSFSCNDPLFPEGYLFNITAKALSSEINICAEVGTELINLDELLANEYFDFEPFPANNESSTQEKEFIIQNRGNITMETLEIYVPFGFEIYDLGEEVIQEVTDNTSLTKENSRESDRQFSEIESNHFESYPQTSRGDEGALGDNREGWYREITTIDIPAGMQHRFKLHFRSYKIYGYDGDLTIISDDRKNNEENDPNWSFSTALDESTIEIELTGEGTPLVISSASPAIDPNQISGDFTSDWEIVCPEVQIYEDIVINTGILLNVNKCNEYIAGDPEPDPVVFKFIESNSIFVEGQIIAKGDKEDFITFRDFDYTDQYYWQGIIFDNNLSSQLSELDYCEIMEAYSSAIKSIDFSNLNVSNSYLHDNLSSYGAAIHCENSDIIIQNNLISANVATNSGGALYCENSDITIQNNLISVNEATNNGGALYSLNSLIQLMNNTIESNTAPNGGGIFLDENRNTRSSGGKINKYNQEKTSKGGTRNTTALIFANYIQNNTASQNGGGIYSNMNEATIKSNVIEGNGAINGGSIFVTSNSNNLLNNTIIANNATSGAGIYCDSGDPIIQNNIIWSNIALDNTQIYPSLFSQNVSYNIIQDNGCDQNNNLDYDPDFVGTIYHPYSLSETSICINGGDRTFIDNDEDILGNYRMTQDHGIPIIDIGAYEYNGDYIIVNQFEINKVDYSGKRFISYSPAHITNNLTIDQIDEIGQILEISPKTTFEFDNALGIDVTSVGSLLAQGDENEEIIFTSTSTSNWGGIFYNRTIDTVDLTYCIFENGISTNGGAISLEGVIDFNLDRCIFQNNEATENGGAINIYKDIYNQPSDNISITNCTFLNNVCQQNGGAVSVVGSKTILIDNSSFIDNLAVGNGASNGYGGSVYNFNSDPVIQNNLTIQNCFFDGNMTSSSTGLSGGAICGRGYNSTNSIRFNEFINNFARGIGGAMYFENTDPDITENYISNCSSNGINPKSNEPEPGYGGGAIALFQCNSNHNSISKNTIEECQSKYGAAINVIDYPSNSNQINITSNIIKNNTAVGDNGDSGDGGGMYFLGSSCSVKWNILSNNTAQNGGALYSSISNVGYEILNNYIHDNIAANGGGVYFNGEDADADPVFVNNTMRNNNASGAGADIYFNNTDCDVNNSILYNEFPQTFSIDLEGTANISVNNCLLSDKAAINANYITLSLNQLCLDEDPAFVSSSSYHLLSESHCRDAGNNVYLDGLDLTVDLDGNDRILNQTVDIGADECNESVIVADIDENTFWSGLIIINSDVTVLSNVTLTIADNTSIIFNQECTLTIANNAKLELGEYIAFISDELDEENGLYTDSSELNIIESSFTNCNLFATGTTIIENSTFENSHVSQEYNTITITTSDFVNTTVYTFRNEKAYLDGNTFTDSPQVTAISLNSCDDFTIINNDISNYRTAIWLNESGLGKDRLIDNNIIYANQYGYGVELYHSYADIKGSNEITNSYIGIAGLRNCNINLQGNQEEPYQIVSNNFYDELVFAYDSFPITFNFNIIYDNINPNQGYLVRCISTNSPGTPLDVRWNYWYNLVNLPDFLYPSNYIYEPYWDLIVPGNLIIPPDQALYELATFNFEHESYFMAEQLFKQVIEDYPESKYTKLAAKDLLAVISFTSDDYEELQTYYRETPNLHYITEVANLVDYLSNYCDIEMGDYASAILWFERYLVSPPSVQDSIYAVIDLGYTYLLMEEQFDRSFISEYPELRSQSKKEFSLMQQELITLLLEEQKPINSLNSTDIIIPPYTKLNCNYPNPFNPETTISYSLDIGTNVCLEIFNIKGQKVKTLINDFIEAGDHKIIWNGKDKNNKTAASGIYFYRLVTDRYQKTKKMMLLK